MSVDPWLNLEEAVAHCRLEKASTLQAAVRRKKIRFSKPEGSRQPIFRTSWVDEWAEKYISPPEEPNQWGLTDGAVQNVLDARPERARRAS